MSELRDPYEPMATEANGLGPADVIARAREALAPVRDALERAGFYAYGTIDDENRWVISADDEAGHVDVRVGPDGYQLELWATAPGLFSEEENDFRRRAMERLARMTIPAVQQGFLAPHQSAWWDETRRRPWGSHPLRAPLHRRRPDRDLRSRAPAGAGEAPRLHRDASVDVGDGVIGS